MYVASEKKFGCGGKIFNSMGMFSSPMYPNPYREDIECTWTILVPLDYKVALKFKGIVANESYNATITN